MKSPEIPLVSKTPNQANSEFLNSKVWQEMVEVGGRICHLLSISRSTGQIFGLLYLSSEPLSLNLMSSMLEISKASASVGTRQLASWGAVRKVWIPGDRRDYYEIIEDFSQLIRGGVKNFIQPKILSSKDRIGNLKSTLLDDTMYQSLPPEKKKILEERISSLEKIHSRICKLIPIAEKIIS